MSLIKVSNLTFAYDGSYDNIFENASFQLDTDWKLGFIGRNGRGKTTFLNLLMGKYEYRGSIHAQTDFEYFPFPVPPGLTARATVEAVCGPLPDWRLKRELSLLELEESLLDRPFAALSGGEQAKLLLAALFLKEHGFLLIDEPTNHLDLRGRQVVSAYLAKKKGFILVSHDRTFLDGCIDHVLSINRTNIEVQSGNFSSWLRNKERQDQYELGENQKLAGEVKRLQKAARQSCDWSSQAEKTKYATKNSGLRPDRGYVGHQAAKVMQRAKSIEARRQTAAEEKSKLLQNIEKSEPLKLSPLPGRAARLVSLEEVSLFYGERRVLGPVSFSLAPGERAALVGRNGCGKSSVLKLILGEDICHTGRILTERGLKLSYVAQDTAPLAGSLSDYAARCGVEESLLKTILRKLDFSRVQFEKDMRDFSGGQKKKVLLARSLCERAHLYIWDEPLNFIDVISRMQIESLLLKFQPTLLFVEHDAAFCARVATKRIEL